MAIYPYLKRSEGPEARRKGLTGIRDFESPRPEREPRKNASKEVRTVGSDGDLPSLQRPKRIAGRTSRFHEDFVFSVALARGENHENEPMPVKQVGTGRDSCLSGRAVRFCGSA